MEPAVEPLIQSLREKFGVGVEEVSEFRDETTVTLRKDLIAEACRFLREEQGFPLLENISGVDQYRPEFRFEVVYHLFNLEKKIRLALKVRVDESDPELPSITGVYAGANWQEREVYDFFGLTFSDHPDLRRVYMPEEFEYYPLRKDFPLMGIPGSLDLPKR